MNSTDDLVSIIVPVYNAAEYIADCIESVLSQTHTNIELILIDDGSTDSSLSICKDYQDTDNRIIVMHTANSGASSARNTGLKICTGSYICFVDSDDVIASDFVSTLLKTLRDTGTDISCCKMSFSKDIGDDTNGSNNMSQKSIKIFRGSNAISFFPTGNREDYDVTGSVINKMYTKEILTERRFATKYSFCEDELFNFSLYINNPSISLAYVDEALYRVRLRETSQTHSRINEKTFDYFVGRVKEFDILDHSNVDSGLGKAKLLIGARKELICIKKFNLTQTSDVREAFKIIFNYLPYILKSKDVSFFLKIKCIVAKYLPYVYVIAVTWRKQYSLFV